MTKNGRPRLARYKVRIHFSEDYLMHVTACDGDRARGRALRELLHSRIFRPEFTVTVVRKNDPEYW